MSCMTVPSTICCPRCGLHNAPHARFCAQCGLNLLRAGVDEVNETIRRGTRWSRLLLLSIALAMILVLFTAIARGRPHRVILPALPHTEECVPYDDPWISEADDPHTELHWQIESHRRDRR